MKKLILLIIFFCSSVFAQESTVVITPRNSVIYDQEVSPQYTEEKINEITQKISKLKPEEDFYLVLETPGGNIDPGLKLLFTVLKLKPNTKTITIKSASMGFEWVQSLGERLIIEKGRLYSHRKYIKGLTFEWPIEPDGYVDKFTKVVDAMDKIASLRMGLSLEAYRKLIMHDYDVYGAQAVRDNAADRVVKVVCGKTMKNCPKAFQN